MVALIPEPVDTQTENPAPAPSPAAAALAQNPTANAHLITVLLSGQPLIEIAEALQISLFDLLDWVECEPIQALLARVQAIADAERRMTDYPFRLSGGMRQRVMVAIALVLKPRLLIADEPTTALDVTIQAQILELIREESRHRGAATLLISEDLDEILELSDRILVMSEGKIVYETQRDSANVTVIGQHMAGHH